MAAPALLLNCSPLPLLSPPSVPLLPASSRHNHHHHLHYHNSSNSCSWQREQRQQSLGPRSNSCLLLRSWHSWHWWLFGGMRGSAAAEAAAAAAAAAIAAYYYTASYLVLSVLFWVWRPEHTGAVSTVQSTLEPKLRCSGFNKFALTRV
jgi:hypothetical protein